MTRFANDSVIACPHCGYLALKKRLASFSTGDLIRWSDGRVDSWFGQPSFTRCSACQGVYWVEDAKCVGEMPRPDRYGMEKRPGWFARLFGRRQASNMGEEPIPDEWLWAQPIDSPDIDAIVIGIETMGDDEPRVRKQRLRRLLWWKLNDRYRSDRRSPHSVSMAIIDRHEQDNLLRLLELSSDEGQPTVETVELLRELGRFDEARSALETLAPNSSSIHTVLATKIAERSCRVCVVQEPSWIR